MQMQLIGSKVPQLPLQIAKWHISIHIATKTNIDESNISVCLDVYDGLPTNEFVNEATKNTHFIQKLDWVASLATDPPRASSTPMQKPPL